VLTELEESYGVYLRVPQPGISPVTTSSLNTQQRNSRTRGENKLTVLPGCDVVLVLPHKLRKLDADHYNLLETLALPDAGCSP